MKIMKRSTYKHIKSKITIRFIINFMLNFFAFSGETIMLYILKEMHALYKRKLT